MKKMLKISVQDIVNALIIDLILFDIVNNYRKPEHILINFFGWHLSKIFYEKRRGTGAYF